jgi:purine-binding chemotaxis protein CheW
MPDTKEKEVQNINAIRASGGKYLTFSLMNEEYGIGILKVKEILGILPITPIPQTPAYLKGVINLRGKITPIIDLRLKFGFPEKEYVPETCIIVIETQRKVMGVIVDTVSEVLDINTEDIEVVPPLGRTVRTDFILGIAKVGESVKLLLDIDGILTMEEMEILETTIEE